MVQELIRVLWVLSSVILVELELGLWELCYNHLALLSCHAGLWVSHALDQLHNSCAIFQPWSSVIEHEDAQRPF